MADSVDTLTLEATPRRRKVRFTNVCDGTGESAVIKLDKSTFADFKGEEPRMLVIDMMKWSIQGFASVRLFWDHTTDDEIAILSGNGERSYWEDGGLKDPISAGGTGDVLLTTNGNVSGATYDIELSVRLEPAP